MFIRRDRIAAGTITASVALLTASIAPGVLGPASAQEPGTTSRVPFGGEMTYGGRYVFAVNRDAASGYPVGLVVWNRFAHDVSAVSDRTSRSDVTLGGVSLQSRYVHYGVPGRADGTGRLKTFVLDRFADSDARERTSILPNDRRTRAMPGDISANGRVALFTVPGSGIYVRNTSKKRTQRVDLGRNGRPRAAGSWEPTFNAATGRVIGFTGRPKRTGSGQLRDPQVWVHNRRTGKTTLVSRARGGGYGNSESRNITLSSEGDHAAFTSFATNLKAKNPRRTNAVFVRNLRTGRLMNVHQSSTGEPGNGGACRGSRYDAGDCVEISKDGRYVAFWSSASNLVPNDTNGHPDLFLRDLGRETTERINVSTVGGQDTSPQSGFSPTELELTPNAEYVLFGSFDPTLAPDEPATTFGQHFYLRDRRPTPSE